MQRFTLSVMPAEPRDSNLLILECRQTGARNLVLAPGNWTKESPGISKIILFSARMEWGGAGNPLLATLPGIVEMPVSRESELNPLVEVLLSEYAEQRCGFASVLSRLGEVLIVRLLRLSIEQGASARGALGGLADPRLSRAIVAIHEAPGRRWRNGDLAEIAGLSRSRFLELFRAAVGMTPAVYLRKWRLTLARQDIARGERIGAVAWRYCYASSEAFGRAFRREFRESPTGRA